MLLDSTSKSIKVVLVEAKTTTDCDMTASYADITTSAFTPDNSDAVTNGVTAVTLVAAPAASTARHVKEITVFNNDTVNHTVHLLLVDGANSRVFKSETLNPGKSMQYCADAPAGVQGVSGADGATGANGANGAAGPAAGTSGTPSDFGWFFSGPPDTSQIVFDMKLTRAITLPASLTGSQFDLATTATATYVVTLNQNGSSIGTLSWAAGAATPTVTFANPVSLAVGDKFTAVGQSTVDATAADFSVMLKCTFT